MDESITQSILKTIGITQDNTNSSPQEYLKNKFYIGSLLISPSVLILPTIPIDYWYIDIIKFERETSKACYITINELSNNISEVVIILINYLTHNIIGLIDILADTDKLRCITKSNIILDILQLSDTITINKMEVEHTILTLSPFKEKIVYMESISNLLDSELRDVFPGEIVYDTFISLMVGGIIPSYSHITIAIIQSYNMTLATSVINFHYKRISTMCRKCREYYRDSICNTCKKFTRCINNCDIITDVDIEYLKIAKRLVDPYVVITTTNRTYNYTRYRNYNSTSYNISYVTSIDYIRLKLIRDVEFYEIFQDIMTQVFHIQQPCNTTLFRLFLQIIFSEDETSDINKIENKMKYIIEDIDKLLVE